MKGWQWDWRITLSLCEGLAVMDWRITLSLCEGLAVGLENNVEFM